MQRIRIHFSKGEELQYTGHLDLHKIWERTFRRAHLPLAYSQGFHPQPRIQLACALPLGFTSSAEMIDAWFDSDLPLEDFRRILTCTIQPGLIIHSLETIPVYETPLQNRVTSATYKLTLLDPIDRAELRKKMDEVMAKESLPRKRRGKAYDLRPLIEEAHLMAVEPHPVIHLQLSARPGATGRPEEFLEELEIDPFAVDVERTVIQLSPLPPKASAE